MLTLIYPKNDPHDVSSPPQAHHSSFGKLLSIHSRLFNILPVADITLLSIAAHFSKIFDSLILHILPHPSISSIQSTSDNTSYHSRFIAQQV